jgi:plasmid stabilization system protein ParE
MSDYGLHPEAFIDIDEIALYIGEDSPEAAHRIVDEIYRAIQSLVPLPHRGASPPGPHEQSTTVYPCTGLPDRLRPG